MSPDGGKASGNERKQPILSERIRAAVHHGADLRGVFACSRMCLSTAAGLSVCENVHIKSLTHEECMCAYARSSMCVTPCVYISASIPASECVRKHIDLEGVSMSVQLSISVQ